MRKATLQASPSGNANKSNDGLQVIGADYDEVFTDMVRIPSAHRINFDNTEIPNGTVIRIDHGGKTAYAIVRGMGERADAVIQMDEFMRDRLGVKLRGKIPSCCIRSATPLEKVFWYCRATNPAVHVPAWLAVISIGLGVFSIVLSIGLAVSGSS